VVVTDEQLRALWEAHESYKGVARAAGLDRNTVRRRLQRLHLEANLVGDETRTLPPPKGFHITQLTQDGEGEVKSIQSKPDVEDPVEAPRLAAILDDHEIKGLSSYVKNGQVTGQWIKTRQSPFSSKELVEAIDRHMEDYRGTPLPECIFAPGRNPAERMNQYVWGDPHIGLLSHARETGKNFDLKIAVSDLKRSVDLLVRKAPMASTAVLCEVGDLWHAQDDRQTTPRGGNKLDVDGRKAKIMEEGLGCLRYMVDRLLQLHDRVIIVIVPGNHDPDLALITRIWLQAVYENNDRIQVLDNTNPYMYLAWGDNFFMYTHGDKRSTKPRDLGDVMLADRPMEVGIAKHRRAFTGHIHHKQVEEFRTFRWESFNSLCAPDFWHHSEGYRSERLVECISFHTRYGEESRVRVTHQELRESA
jgi:hypothetical protein